MLAYTERLFAMVLIPYTIRPLVGDGRGDHLYPPQPAEPTRYRPGRPRA
jgi:hypothetical protein